MTNFYPFKLKEFADDNFKFDENGRKLYKKGRKHWGTMRNCSYKTISTFPTVYSKDLYCRHVKTRACLGKGYIDLNWYFTNVPKWLEKVVQKKKRNL